MGKSRKHNPTDKWERLGGMAALGAVVAPATATPVTTATMNTDTATMTTAATPATATVTTATTAATPVSTPAPAPAPATTAAPAAAPTTTTAATEAAPAAKADMSGRIIRQWLLDHTVPERMLRDKTLDFLGIMPESCTVQAKAGDGGILLVVGPAADVLSFYHKGKGDWKFQSPSQAPGGLVTLPVMGLSEPEVIRSTEVKTVVVPPPPKTGFAGLVDREIVGGVTVGQVATAGVAVAGAYTIYQNREAIIDGIKAIPTWFGFGKKEES